MLFALWSHAWKKGLAYFHTTSLKRLESHCNCLHLIRAHKVYPAFFYRHPRTASLQDNSLGVLPSDMAASEAWACSTICCCFWNNPEGKKAFTVMGLVSSVMKAVLTGASSSEAISITCEDGNTRQRHRTLRSLQEWTTFILSTDAYILFSYLLEIKLRLEPDQTVSLTLYLSPLLCISLLCGLRLSQG